MLKEKFQKYTGVGLAFIASVSLFSCENIDEADRYIEVGQVEVARKVLLEEFTGQKCVNCPDAHQIIENLEEQYGDNLIVVSIHAGPFGIPTEDDGLATPDGDVYAERWGISAYPAGVVDRSSGVETMSQWATTIRNDLELKSPLQISLEAQLSDDRKNINVFTTLASANDLTGSLQLWVVENGIIGYQIYGSDRLQDYEHNNVFRACVNGIWGQETKLKEDEVKYLSNTVALQEDWNLDNLRIIGFYYNNSGVIQVERCEISH